MTQDEEHEASEALRNAKDKDELMAVWWSLCDHSTGAQRERLQDVYAIKVREFAPMARAG
mgnify:CR=1 FL=1